MEMIDGAEKMKVDKGKFCSQTRTHPLGRVHSCLCGVVIDSELNKVQCAKPAKVLMTT